MFSNIPMASADDCQLFAKKYGTDELTSRLLLRRNITSPETLKYFLHDDLRIIHNPFAFSQMDLMVDRIGAAIGEGEKVLVFGDRDSDGITATVLLVETLRGRGLEVFWEVPMGDDHYGLQIPVIDTYAAKDVTLLITVDCGIGNVSEVAHAASLGIDSLIVDHHNPGDVLPDAVAIVNPKTEGENYPFEGLSAVALALKVSMALEIADSDLYNQTFCLLNARPGNDSIIVEAVKMTNLVEQQRITETFVNGSGESQLARLVDFIRDQAILVYQAEPQKKLFEQLFGTGVEIAFTDIAPEIWKQFPQLRDRSLLRMLQGSRLSRFSSRPTQEIDAAVQLLISYLHARNPAILDTVRSQLDLTALGLIADMMPLLDENRILVRHGLQRLAASERPGLRELMARLGLLGRHLTSTEVSWKLTPSINATGRMGKPDLAVRLLLGEGDPSALADEIYALNEERKRLGSEAWDAVLPGAKQSLEEYAGNLTVVRHDRIHRGITGIVAGRLSRKFEVPSVVIAELEEHFVGSVRSIRGFHVTDFLSRFEDLLDDYGGHDAAGGFHLSRNRIEEFMNRLRSSAENIELGNSEEREIDLELRPDDMTEELEAFQKRLEPMGMEFPPISYLVRGARIESAQVIGKDQSHLKLLLAVGRRKWPAVYWGAADRFNLDFSLNSRVDCSFTMERNYYGANSSLQLNIIDMEPADAN
jgi:single-stranded-DNA-specific exonuclease